jgi:hypothetical protein
MITGVLAMLLSFIKESRASKRLAKRLDLVRKKTGITHFRIANPDYTPDIQTFVKVALRRPVRLFFTDPIVTIISIMSAVGWALIYLLTGALPVIYGAYGLSWSQSSLIFFIIEGGIFFGISLVSMTTDFSKDEPNRTSLSTRKTNCFALPSLLPV